MPHLQCAGVVVYRDNANKREYLLIHNTKGHWDFPKGKQEPEESLVQTALRELYEETGLVVTLGPELSVVRWQYSHQSLLYSKTCHFFMGKSDPTAAVILSAEHSTFIWASFKKAYSLVEHESTRSLLLEAEKLCIKPL